MNMPNASQAALRADRAYLDLLEAESTWALMYNMSRTNPWTPRAYPVQGLNQPPGIGPAQVDAYNRLLPVHYRVGTRASQNRLHTELFGTAPYTALGRGILEHVDVNSALQQSEPMHERGSKVHTMERPFQRQYYISLPDELRRMPVETRLGAATRVSPEYLQPHDE